MYKTIITSNSEYFLQSSIWMDIIRSSSTCAEDVSCRR